MPIDHCFALGNPALSSAPAKKSGSPRVLVDDFGPVL